MRILFYRSPSTDGHDNLALDEYFLNTLGEEDFLLYLYVNANAVIIGKNQNAWKECNVARMEADGVQLVRRISGGGAVYHDNGNLNFSFIAGERHYDLERQLGLILAAVKALGIDAEFSGRNDITAGGRKFSGNAFCARRTNRQHHGTLLIDADLTKLSGYLNVPVQKIRAKGIDSVRARVCNLKELNPALDLPTMVDALQIAFKQLYGDYEVLDPKTFDAQQISELHAKQCAWEWRLGSAPAFDYEIETRFAWGGIELCLTMEDGHIVGAKLYTDAMDPELSEVVCKALEGAQFRSDAIADRLQTVKEDEHIKELAEYIRGLRL